MVPLVMPVVRVVLATRQVMVRLVMTMVRVLQVGQ